MSKKDDTPKALAVVEADRMNAPIVRIGPDKLAYEPTDADQAFRMAKWLCSSGFYPSFKKPEQAFVVMAKGKELGMSTLQSVDGMHVIQGKVTLAAQTMVALVKNSGKAAFFKCTHSGSKSATWETLRIDDPTGQPTTATFTIEQAKQREYTKKQNWKQMPENMLRWRAATELARMEYPEVIQGLYSTEEMLDHSRQPTPKTIDAKVMEQAIEESAPPPEIEHLTLNEVKARIKERKNELGERYCFQVAAEDGVDTKDLHAVLAVLDAVRDERLAWISQYWALAKRLGFNSDDVAADLKPLEASDPTEVAQEQLEEAVLGLRHTLEQRD